MVGSSAPRLTNLRSWRHRILERATGGFKARFRVWNNDKKRWVRKDVIYVLRQPEYFIEAYKAGRGDFRLMSY